MLTDSLRALFLPLLLTLGLELLAGLALRRRSPREARSYYALIAATNVVTNLGLSLALAVLSAFLPRSDAGRALYWLLLALLEGLVVLVEARIYQRGGLFARGLALRFSLAANLLSLLAGLLLFGLFF